MALGRDWRKSSHSSTDGECVEARDLGCGVEVRDTKDRAGVVLGFGPAAWTDFLVGLREGDYRKPT